MADTWNEDLLAEIIGNAVEEYAKEFDAEQAVRGVDSLTENELLGRIRKSLIRREILVAEEERYPDAWCVDRLNEGRRCDLVLLPFNAASDLRGKADWCSAGYWLEAKRLAQFLESGPNWWYEQSLLQIVSQDIYKLATDSSIFFAGVLLILFAATQESGSHDLKEWKCRAIKKGCPVGLPRIHHFSITNRFGNGHAFVALFPLRRL